MSDNQLKWDLRFLDLAKFFCNWSKDPSTKTGAAIVDKNKRIISTGYNGFAKGVQDYPDRYNDRELKYKFISHCENNAILFARRPLKGCTLYTYPFQSCSRCAVSVIQSGIIRCVAPVIPEHLKSRWGEDMELASIMFKEADVELNLIDHDNKLSE